MIREYRGKRPHVDEMAWVAETAAIIGDVKIGPGSSVWYSAVVRGDVNYIRIGAAVNIQDGAVVHVTSGEYPVVIEHEVTVGHNATVHGCYIERGALIGLGAVLLDGACIGKNSMIAAASVVPRNTIIPEGVLVMGSPGRVVRDLTPAEIRANHEIWMNYVGMGDFYLRTPANPF